MFRSQVNSLILISTPVPHICLHRLVLDEAIFSLNLSLGYIAGAPAAGIRCLLVVAIGPLEALDAVVIRRSMPEFEGNQN